MKAAIFIFILSIATVASAAPLTIETPHLAFTVDAATGRVELRDRDAGVTWASTAAEPRVGTATLRVDGKERQVRLAGCEGTKTDGGIVLTFHPLENQPGALCRVTVRAEADGRTLALRHDADAALPLEKIRLLDDLLATTGREHGAVLIPVRAGLLIPADSKKTFTHRFDTYAYEGCHLAMFGMMKGGAALLAAWDSPDAAVDVRSTTGPSGGQTLSASLELRKSTRDFRLRVLGKGDHVTIARAYREVAKEHGLLVPWSEKLKGHPERERLFGAVNFKLWSVLNRRMNEESTHEESVRVNWTFDEAAQVAEHLRRDLQLERVIFTLGGWIHRGYDNQHPDILPAAPECGGDAALADCARRVRQLGYVFGLHDNYQDIYRDSPSWDENLIMRDAAGALVKGGRWAGGRAFLTCSRMALDLAKRPQNLSAVRKLVGPAGYFIDTTFAAGLHECFAPAHPLTRADDLRWKQKLADYARETFGIFGSECGREWAIPHADFFEGMTGVSGGNFHNEKLQEKLGAVVVPLFELVFRDCIAAWGKYGYDPAHAAEYVLQQLVFGRPLNHHNIPAHLYWKSAEHEPLAITPGVTELKRRDVRSLEVTWRWDVEKTPDADLRVFVHFTDADGNIKFQGDYTPRPGTKEWPRGEVRQGPFVVRLPEGASGTFEVRVGLLDPVTNARAQISRLESEHRSYRIGKVRLDTGDLTFEPELAPARPAGGDPALFTRADGGWASGMHAYDRFVKNTAELLSPLHELTATLPMTRHEFLTPDRKVQRTVFGDGADAVEVIVNTGAADYRHTSRLGGAVLLPPFGLVVEGPAFAAFHAKSWAGVSYDNPPLFTLRSLDAKPLATSQRVRVFHAFGDARLNWKKETRTITRDAVITSP
ncbi:MAG: hypothetical protein JNM65_09640 [Verrucomicrobiaceae bacterium]|nr:hypothetical protein [Verrucomicrobiaceae bacterium]